MTPVEAKPSETGAEEYEGRGFGYRSGDKSRSVVKAGRAFNDYVG